MGGWGTYIFGSFHLSVPIWNLTTILFLCSREEDFGRWSTLPLSLAGRVNLIKMAVLPRFLYLFRHIPVLISKKYFAKLDQSISTFLWAGKPLSMWKKILQLPKWAGGLALPNLLHYYWAANIQKCLFLTVESTISQPAWVQMEFSSTQMSLRSWLCSPLPVSVTNVSTSLVVTIQKALWPTRFLYLSSSVPQSQFQTIYYGFCLSTLVW